MTNSKKKTLPSSIAVLAVPTATANKQKPIPARPITLTNVGDQAQVWSLDKLIIRASNVLLPDGTREGFMEPADPETGRWRRMGEDGKWIYGHLSMSDDVKFVDTDYQIPPYSRAADKLGGILVQSRMVQELCRDKDFARCLCEALGDHSWKTPDDKRVFEGNWTVAARIVAQIRGLNESYLDFFDSGIPGFVRQDIIELFESLGWEYHYTRDTTTDMVKAEQIVVRCERENVRDTPLWYSCWAMGLSTKDTLDARMHRCAYRGQAHLRDWEKFYTYFDWES